MCIGVCRCSFLREGTCGTGNKAAALEFADARFLREGTRVKEIRRLHWRLFIYEYVKELHVQHTQKSF